MVNPLGHCHRVLFCTRSRIKLMGLYGSWGIGFRIPLGGLAGLRVLPGLVVTTTNFTSTSYMCQASTTPWQTPPPQLSTFTTASSSHIYTSTSHIPWIGTFTTFRPPSGTSWLPCFSTSASPSHFHFIPQEIYLRLEAMQPVLLLDAHRPRSPWHHGPSSLLPDLFEHVRSGLLFPGETPSVSAWWSNIYTPSSKYFPPWGRRPQAQHDG